MICVHVEYQVQQIIFSDDGNYLASATRTKVQLWDRSKKILLRSIFMANIVPTEQLATLVRFVDGRLLVANEIHPLVSEFEALPVMRLTSYWSISKDQDWILWNFNRVLWLPVQYRPHLMLEGGGGEWL